MNLKFSGKIFVSKSISHKNQQLTYKSEHLQNARKTHTTWFFNNVLNTKLMEHEKIHKIFHATDIEYLLEKGDLEEEINNASF